MASAEPDVVANVLLNCPHPLQPFFSVEIMSVVFVSSEYTIQNHTVSDIAKK